ncbi:GerMN domain-containing protein [Actinoalloteichus spitiensis]|uniref:GerMN domain-containing protein n=1 Tax=Actinoalloteichus spitiensis TaxID=252394 RepID=UPI000362CEF8|nr:GerMN domain-containing protein [Actinoalloteichus spitiensis]
MRHRPFATAWAGLALIALTSCGPQLSTVEEGPSAPTGIAAGTTLYFLDDDGRLTAQHRETGRLGTVSEAVSLLLTGPGGSGLRTGIEPTTVTRNQVTVNGELMSVRVPVSSAEVSAEGIDQIVCTAFASRVQSGGPDRTRVAIEFTDRPEAPRSCPALG